MDIRKRPRFAGSPDQGEQPCDICQLHVDDCTCPECPKCGAFGDPKCFHQHGLDATVQMRAIYRDVLRLEGEIREREHRKERLLRGALLMTGVEANTVVALDRGHANARPPLFARAAQFRFEHGPQTPEQSARGELPLYPSVQIRGSTLTKDGRPNEREKNRYGSVAFHQWTFTEWREL